MFNQNSFLVKFWAEKNYREGFAVPNLFNLQVEVALYIENNFEPVPVEEPLA